MTDLLIFTALLFIAGLIVYFLNFLSKLREEFNVARRIIALEQAVFHKDDNQFTTSNTATSLAKVDVKTEVTPVPVRPPRKQRTPKPAV